MFDGGARVEAEPDEDDGRRDEQDRGVERGSQEPTGVTDRATPGVCSGVRHGESFVRQPCQAVVGSSASRGVPKLAG